MYSDRANQSPPFPDPAHPADAATAAAAVPQLLPLEAMEGIDAFSTDACPSSNPQSQIQSPNSEAHSPPPSPFPECEGLSDTLLAKIAAGTECLASIASYHNIPYPRFTLWLLEPSTQARLAALSVAIASAARLTATAALPDIVRGLKTTVDQLQHPSHPTIAAPGPDHLRAQSLILRRHRALIAAASLIYRISRFTVPSPRDPRHRDPCHRDHPRSADALDAESRARSHAPTSRNNSATARRGLPPLPKLDLPAISNFADPDSSPHIPSVASVNSVVQPRSVATDRSPPASGVDSASATPVDASPSSVFTSHFPHPTSHIEPPTSDINVDAALRILTAEYDLTAEEVAELRDTAHTWIRDFIPPAAAAKPATRRARCSRADDG